MGPMPNRHLSATGKPVIKLFNPLQEPAEATGVRLGVIVGTSVQHVITVASQGENCCSQRCMFGVEDAFRDALTPARDSRRDGPRNGIGPCPLLTV